MARFSNSVVCFANFFAILIAAPLLCAGLWMKTEAKGQCQQSVQWLTIVTACALLVIALCGIFGSCCRLNFFLWIYLFLMVFLIVGVLISMGFSFLLTSKDVGETLEEYKLADNNGMLQRWALKDWDETEKCMKETKLCENRMLQFIERNNKTMFGHLFQKSELHEYLSPVEYGCCSPPSDCGYTYNDEKGTWEPPKEKTKSKNPDCKLWNKDQQTCYGCKSCQAAMVITTRKNLKLNAWIDVGVLVLLLIIYIMGCCAYSNNQSNRYERA